MSVTAALAGHAARTPQRDALVFEDQRLSWRALNEAVDRLAMAIAATTPPASGVALHLPTGPALALLALAAARAGREAQILDPDWPPAMARAILGTLTPARTITADVTLAGVRVTLLDDPFAPADALLAALDAPAAVLPVAEPGDLLPFYVGFTSGSTGEPKGYRRHHRSWTESFRHDAIEFAIGVDDVVLAPGTLTHSLFLYALMHGLHAGARVVLCRRFRPDAVVRLIAEEQASVLYGVPTQFQLIAEAAGARTFAAPRWLLSSGAKSSPYLPAQLLARFPGARFAEFYGASETSFMTVAIAAENVPEGSVGRAFSGTAITIRDRAGRTLPSGRTGYVFVASPFLFMGYACGKASDLLHHGEAVSVGDIGFLDHRGFQHHSGGGVGLDRDGRRGDAVAGAACEHRQARAQRRRQPPREGIRRQARDRHDLAGDSAARQRLAMALHREGFLRRARHVPFVRKPRRRGNHVGVTRWPRRERRPVIRLGRCLGIKRTMGAKRRTAEAFETARDDRIGFAGADPRGGHQDGVETGAALGIDRRRRHRFGHAGQQRRDARRVAAAIQRVAKNNFVDVRRRDAGVRAHRADHRIGQHGGLDCRECAVARRDRGPSRGDHEHAAHGRLVAAPAPQISRNASKSVLPERVSGQSATTAKTRGTL